MIYYEITYRYRMATGDETDDKDREQRYEDDIKSVNRQLHSMRNEKRYCCIFRADKDELMTIAACAGPDDCVSYEEELTVLAETVIGVCDIVCSDKKEITVGRFRAALEIYRESGLNPNRRFFASELNLEMESRSFHLEEEVVDPEPLTREAAMREAKTLMADPGMLDELERIYSPKNSDSFYGYPVHYHLKVSSMSSAMDIMRLMIRALHSRGRLPSCRLSTVTSVEGSCYDETGMDNLIRNSGLSAVAIEMRGGEEESETASDYDRAVRYISRLVLDNYGDTLFFFIENSSVPGFGKLMLTQISDAMDIMTINEGRGDKKEAYAYLDRLVAASRYAELADEMVYKKLEDKYSYRASDVHSAFDEWKRRCLKEKAYAAYRNYSPFKIKKKHKKTKAFERLMNMPGLEEVKELTLQILAFYRLRSMRERYNIGGDLSSHMVFTGNPGCAKTTVARLIAEILTQEHILRTGAFVECGRADLVGRYVGWTAKAVERRFKEARGGVLFIDEAYSLADEGHSFGEEAINTIVQQMENMRKEVIVIFAGYPEPMERFISKNAGLSSRIAFHMDFKDYDKDELVQILKLMADERGLKIEDDALEKCRGIFYNACRQKDFGNGRYVRNLLEKAMLDQARRLTMTGKRNALSKTAVTTLIAEDFNEGNISDSIAVSRRIGFL